MNDPDKNKLTPNTQTFVESDQKFLAFEKSIQEVSEKISALRSADLGDPTIKLQTESLEKEREGLIKKTYSKLSIWETVQVARHPQRPHTLDFIKRIFTDFDELHGDRQFADDQSIVGGMAYLDGIPVMIIGHEKGRDTEEKVRRNFGMPQPEGYRKAIRLMEMADKFGLPIITLVDTPGAYPGKGAEERGQSEAIARSTEKCLQVRVPLISIITGEGGSGGAVAFATADKLLMLEHSVYSVISPEGCASILWKDSEKMREAAEALRLTAQDLKKLGVADKVMKEPLGGAQRDHKETYKVVKKGISDALKELQSKKPDALLKERRKKFLELGSKSL